MFTTSDNKRTEIAMVGCTNLFGRCGVASGTGVYENGLYPRTTSTTKIVTISKASILDLSDKL